MRGEISGRIHAWIYAIHRVAHFYEREAVIERAIDLLRSRGRTPIRRIVDYGCGCGDLVHAAARKKLEYIGIDIDPFMVKRSERMVSQHEGASLRVGGVEVLDDILAEGDILILSAVAHHMTDDELARAGKASARCGRVIIVDHDMVKRETGSFPTYWIQRLDLGKFLRPIEWFDTFGDLTMITRERFPVRLIWYPLWPLFFAVYERASAEQTDSPSSS